MWLRHAIVVTGATIALIPSMGWIKQAWAYSPLDKAGPLFAAVGVGWALLVGVLAKGYGRSFDPTAWPIVLLALLGACIGEFFNINVLQAGAGVVFSWGLAWALYGASTGLLLLPSVVCLVLALPTTSYLIGVLWRMFGLAPVPGPAVKVGCVLIALGLGSIGIALQRGGRSLSPGPMATTYGVLALLALGGVLLALRPPAFGPPVRLDEQQWAFGRWLGAEIPSSPIEQRLYKDYRLSKRSYASNQGHLVVVLIVESDDVHKLHPPEYCLSGSGWQVEQSGLSTWAFGHIAAVAAGLRASRDGSELKAVYWFSSRSRSTADLVGLRLRSGLVPDEPFTLYMVTAIAAVKASSEHVLADFLAAAPWQAQ